MDQEPTMERPDPRALLKSGLESLRPKSKTVQVDLPNGFKLVFKGAPSRKEYTAIEASARKEVQANMTKSPDMALRAFCEEDPVGAQQCAELARYFVHMLGPDGEILPEIWGFSDFYDLAVNINPTYFSLIYQQVWLAHLGTDINAEVNDLTNFSEETGVKGT